MASAGSSSPYLNHLSSAHEQQAHLMQVAAAAAGAYGRAAEHPLGGVEQLKSWSGMGQTAGNGHPGLSQAHHWAGSLGLQQSAPEMQMSANPWATAGMAMHGMHHAYQQNNVNNGNNSSSSASSTPQNSADLASIHAAAPAAATASARSRHTTPVTSRFRSYGNEQQWQ